MGVKIELDGAGGSVEVATREEITAHFVELYDWILNSTSREELVVDFPGDGGQGSKTTPATAKLWTFFNLGGPKVGWLWDVMRLSINGNDPTATVAGTVFAFSTGTVPADAAAIDPLGSMVEVGTGTLPNTAFYGRQQFVIRPGNKLVIACKTLPNATQVFVGGHAIQYRDPAAGTPFNPYRQKK